MKFPDNIKYTAQHLWVRQESDGICFAGITDYAQDLLGDIVFVDAPTPGQTLEAGKSCGLVESVKTGSDLHAPMNGTVETVNDKLKDNPEQINDAPYEAWIFSFRPHDTANEKGLLSAAEYQQMLGEI